MFSGIVQKLGRIEETTAQSDSPRLRLSSDLFDGTHRIGDSIAVSGVCLTIVKLGEREASFDVSAETLRRTSLGQKQCGAIVNLEPSVRVGDALHGHIVQGHVDTTAQLLDVKQELGGFRMRFSLSPEIAVFVAPKGSLALDGISLTIGEVDSESFSVYIVPHTWDNTTLHALQIGGRVNIETDCLAKYLFRMVQASKHLLPAGEQLDLPGRTS